MKKDLDQKVINDELNYNIINYVYKYHPFFVEDDGQKIIEIYSKYGMGVIKSMVYVAREAKKVYARIQSLEDELSQCRSYIERFKSGTFSIDL